MDPFSINTPRLCDFFLWLFSVHGLKPITIKGYASALARVFNLCQLQDPTKQSAVKALINNFDLERPRSVTIFPKWNINIVLDFLQEDRFTILESIDNADLTHKTVFLIALATAFRVSEFTPSLDLMSVYVGMTMDLFLWPLMLVLSPRTKDLPWPARRLLSSRWCRTTSCVLCASFGTTFTSPGSLPPHNSSFLSEAQR